MRFFSMYIFLPTLFSTPSSSVSVFCCVLWTLCWWWWVVSSVLDMTMGAMQMLIYGNLNSDIFISGIFISGILIWGTLMIGFTSAIIIFGFNKEHNLFSPIQMLMFGAIYGTSMICSGILMLSQNTLYFCRLSSVIWMFFWIFNNYCGSFRFVWCMMRLKLLWFSFGFFKWTLTFVSDELPNILRSTYHFKCCDF